MIQVSEEHRIFAARQATIRAYPISETKSIQAAPAPHAGLWVLSHTLGRARLAQGESPGNRSAPRSPAEQKLLCTASRGVVAAEAAVNAAQQRATEAGWSMLLSPAQSPEAGQAGSHPSPLRVSPARRVPTIRPGRTPDSALRDVLGKIFSICPSKIQEALAYYDNDLARDLGTVFSVHPCSVSPS